MVEAIKKEDPSIEHSELLDSQFSPIQDSSINVLDSLEDPEKTFYLKLNDDLFNFDSPTLDVKKEAKKASRSDLVNALRSTIKGKQAPKSVSGLDSVSVNEPGTICRDNIEKFLLTVETMLNANEKEQLDEKDVMQILSVYSQDVQNSPASHHRVGLARRHIYQLYLKKIQIMRSIQELESVKKEIDKNAQFRTNMLFSSIFLAYLTEFAVGYYCIYEVDWLGWDLVEPVTYTLAQGQFVLGTWFF